MPIRRLISIVAVAAALPLTACTPSSYRGIPFAAGAADPGLQALAQRARSGDKLAQLELGIRFEEGIGVPVDLGRAERLYRAAATASGGTIMVYVPGIRGRPGTVMPMSTGPRMPGLKEARNRLRALEARRAALRDGPQGAR